MQRVPTRNMPQGASSYEEEASPLLRMARRIREEQGAEQVKAFLAAMAPFAAPNEIRRVGEGFGISFESIELERTKANKTRPPAQQNEGRSRNNMMEQLAMLMQLSGMMKNGKDMSGLLSMLNGK